MQRDRAGQQWQVAIAGIAVATVCLAAALPAAADTLRGLSVAIQDAGMVGPILRVTVAVSGLSGAETDPATVDVSVRLDGVPTEASLPLIQMPPRFAMDFDLAAGVVRVGSVSVGRFAPLPRFAENMRFPIDVTIRHGARTAAAHREVTVPLPAVIVPGYLNEWDGPSDAVLAAFRRRGYTVGGPGRNVFWFTYASRDLALPDAARALAVYVRRDVLPETYAAKVNVVGYSLGGLMARWNVAYDVDGWSTLVSRLALVGVPNEGTVLAYLANHAPSGLPFAGLGRTSAAPAFMPTFPFWRPAPAVPWSVPRDAENVLLADLNERPIPAGIRVSVFYGSHDPRGTAGPQTSAGITGLLPEAELAYAPGDGLVLAASAQGLPIRGGDGVPALLDRPVLRVDLGSVYHTRLLEVGAGRIADTLLDRFESHLGE
ncbi:MAG TPA: hypothetical protein VJT33_02045 [bacterium]|nr:hypothetical protein [bacterium]